MTQPDLLCNITTKAKANERRVVVGASILSQSRIKQATRYVCHVPSYATRTCSDKIANELAEYNPSLIHKHVCHPIIKTTTKTSGQHNGHLIPSTVLRKQVFAILFRQRRSSVPHVRLCRKDSARPVQQSLASSGLKGKCGWHTTHNLPAGERSFRGGAYGALSFWPWNQ